MTQIIPTTFSNLIYQIQDMLSTADAFDSDNCVYIGNRPELNVLQPSLGYAVITFGNRSSVSHSGPTPTLMTDLIITVWSFNASDQDVRAEIRDTNISDYIDAVIAVLDGNMIPDQTSTYWITTLPLLLKSISPITEESGWAKCELKFDLKYWFGVPSNADFASSDFFAGDFACA